MDSNEVYGYRWWEYWRRLESCRGYQLLGLWNVLLDSCFGELISSVFVRWSLTVLTDPLHHSYTDSEVDTGRCGIWIIGFLYFL